MRASKYFRILLSAKLRASREDFIEIEVPCSGVSKIEILLACLMTGHLVVPETFGYKEWIDLYRLSDYFALSQIENLILYQMYSLIAESSLDTIFNFAQEYNLEDLALACTRYLLAHNCKTKITECNKYYQISSQLNRF